MRRITNQDEVLPYSVSDVEDVSGERVTWFIRVLELRNFFVAAPDGHFPGTSVLRIVLARNSEIDKIVFRRPLSAREVLGKTATVLVQVSLNGMKRFGVEASRIEHEISVHAIPIV